MPGIRQLSIGTLFLKRLPHIYFSTTRVQLCFALLTWAQHCNKQMQADMVRKDSEDASAPWGSGCMMGFRSPVFQCLLGACQQATTAGLNLRGPQPNFLSYFISVLLVLHFYFLISLGWFLVISDPKNLMVKKKWKPSVVSSILNLDLYSIPLDWLNSCSIPVNWLVIFGYIIMLYKCPRISAGHSWMFIAHGCSSLIILHPGPPSRGPQPTRLWWHPTVPWTRSTARANKRRPLRLPSAVARVCHDGNLETWIWKVVFHITRHCRSWSISWYTRAWADPHSSTTTWNREANKRFGVVP